MPRKKRESKFGAKYEALMEEIAALRKKAREEAGNLVRAGLSDIFEEYPKLQSIGWRQYTPYFNDGDECVFHACTDEWSIILNGSCPDYGDEPDDDDTSALTEEEHSIIAKEVSDFLSGISDDDLKDMFGDHTKVYITRDGKTDTEEYDHD